jgi:hypothetical protein
MNPLRMVFQARVMVAGLVLLGGLAVVACGDDDDSAPSPTATEAASTATASPTKPATEEPTREPTVAPSEPTGPDYSEPAEVLTGGGPVPESAILDDVRVGRNEGFDRIVFEFRGSDIPEWEVRYVQRAEQCGSGKPVPVGGNYILQVTMRSTAAHEDGELTIDATQLTAAFPQMTEAIQICDFEGVVTWVIGTQEKVPFRAFELDGPARLVVDVKQ